MGDAIRATRNEVGISQEALADAAGINRTHMGEVERGKRNVSLLAIARIAQALGRTPSELLAAAGL
ncbi:helix-turn-helix transcriptional regulator [Caulobacter sp. NIBR2454]|uniref:helix-turn-helix transcriptional regulator n=1 Tax=Caulobacter sp. NIBR2454 TaxID=3015996 RepID=UPI0022B67F1D|nr:helix-turn-helix transcriptional regulator [Caulobacter sp. NIBR2454]